MKAIGLYRHLPIDDPESLINLDIPKPAASGRDLLVKVRAISVNPVDTKIRKQGNPDLVEKEPQILGWDVAGVVEAVGSEVTLFKPGDEVYYAGDITRPGGNSEFHLIDERIVGNKPQSLDFAQAAALPLTTLTAWEALFSRMDIPLEAEKNRGKTLLVQGAAGGVGSITTQLADWAGLTVIGTASRPETIQWAKDHGADATANHHQPLAAQIRHAGYEHIDYIFCTSNMDKQWEDFVDIIAPQGKICTITGVGPAVNFNALKDKSATFVWEYMYTRSRFQTPDMIEQHHILNTLAQLIDNGVIRTTLTERLTPLNAQTLRQAHAMIEKGSMIGKVVIENFPG